MDVSCSFGWFDGESGHVCHSQGVHAQHACSSKTCTAVYDPNLRIVPGPDGGFRTVKRESAMTLQ